MSKASEMMKSARVALVLDQPFFGTLALRLNVKEDPACETAATDGTNLIYNPRFVESLTPRQLLGLYAHEVMHCACGHPWRKDGREHMRWNAACDYAINDVLKESGFELPEGGLIDPKYKGKSAEWIYDRLDSNSFPKSVKFGIVLEAPPPGDGDDEGEGGGAGGSASVAVAADWQVAVQQAAAAAKANGNLPAALERFVGEGTKSKVDWRSVLRRFVQQAARSDYTWRMPSSRYVASGLYMPALHSERVGTIAVAVDTSGSIDGPMLSAFNAELQSIIGEVRPQKVLVIYCDAKVHRVDTFEDEDIAVLKPVGGGGTDFRPVFEYLDKQDEAPACLVYLTDMYGTFPKGSPIPTLWATQADTKKAPFGEVVEIA